MTQDVPESMYRTVLVALDGSKKAERIFPFVVPLLRRSGPTAVLAHVVDGRVLGRAAAQAYLRLVARKLEARGILAEWESPKGDAAVELLRLAARRKGSLLAMTTHGRSGVARWILGSVAHKVLRGATCPVLLAKGVGEMRRDVDTVLVPLDGSPRAELAMPHALEFARAFGARLVLQYVTPEAGIEAADSKLRRWFRSEREKAGRRFAEIAASLPGLQVDAFIDEGDPAVRILRRADRFRRSLVVMSTHGRTGIRRFVMGSVAEKVLQATPAPLLIVRSFPG